MLNGSYFRILFCVILFSVSSVHLLYSQILDDSTKQLYGYHSIKYATEEDVFMNAGFERKVDSSILSLQRYGYIYHNNQFSQDLGNWGTALKSVTSIMPAQLGRQTGFDSYSPYEVNPNQVKYYNTRSPFAEVKYYQGSRGQQSIDATITRNINPYWNVGFDLRRMVSRKILGQINPTDKQAENYSFDCFVSHHAKNERYYMLATFTHLYLKNYDTGGMKIDTLNQTKDDIFIHNLTAASWQILPVNLSDVRSLDRRYNYRVYQQYDLIEDHRLQVFYRFDYSRRTNRYDDLALDSNASYYTSMLHYKPVYKNGNYDTSVIRDRTDFGLLDNRVGVKGNTASIFYAAFIKYRYITMTQNSYSNALSNGLNNTASLTNKYKEWYGAGQFRKYMNEEHTSYIDAIGEVGLGNSSTSSRGNYMGALTYKKSSFTAKGSIWSVSPALIQQQYISDMVSWQNHFNLQKTDNINVKYEFIKKKIDITPSLNISSYKDYIYYTSNGVPAQYNNTILHIQPSLGLRFNLWKVHVYNQFQYNYLKNDSAYILRMPSIVNATQIFWESWLFKKATFLQTGFDVLCRNSYYAYGYNPMLQQYYVTETTGGHSSFNYVNGYVVVDFFVNMQIRTARIFIKLSNLTQGLFEKNGYFATPYYSGLPRTIDFGISWRFFD